MKRRAWALGALGVCGVLLSFCVGDDSGSSKDSGGSDGTVPDGGADVVLGNDAPSGPDAPEEPPAQGFTLSVTPAHVTADPGDSNMSVTINVNRAAGFSENISFTIASPPPHVTATTPGDTGNAGTTSTFTVSLDAQATNGDVSLQINGKSTSWSASATLGIHIGSVLQIGSGTFTVPPFANAVIVKAWGAGGAGGQTTSSYVGSAGGAGGFASATIPVSPGANLEATAATAGEAASPCQFGGGGGGGGGFSALRVQGANTYFLIAGGGGGGGSGSPGGSGGGAIGGDATGACGAKAGTQSQGGAAGGCPTSYTGAPGSSYQGGAGYQQTGACDAGSAGAPGGGKGGDVAGDVYACGGGGGGFFGGGGGSFTNSTAGGGGGGSGFMSVDGGTLTMGNGANPVGTNDPDYARCPSGTGVGGAGSTADAGATAGGPGCIVVRLPKP